MISLLLKTLIITIRWRVRGDLNLKGLRRVRTTRYAYLHISDMHVLQSE